MSQTFDALDRRRDALTLPAFRVAVALSVLLHVLMLGKWLPQVHLPSADDLAERETSRSLVVNLVPPASPPPAPQPAPAPAPRSAAAPAVQAPPPAARPRPAPPPPVIALNKPRPDVPSPPPAVAAPARPTPAPGSDLSSYIEAQRRSRAEAAAPAPFPPSASLGPPAPVEDAATRGDRAIAANLGLNRAPTFGADSRSGGGIFQIQRLGYSDAEFLFYGWNKDIRRNTTQLIEVRKGEASDIRVAVIRRMIAIIREHEQEDFLWESPRLGRNITLSARQRDNAGLEEFMMREFFSGARP